MNWLTELLEDDYYGLWEILWRFNQLKPGQSEDENLIEVRQILNRALKDGAVSLYDKEKSFLPVPSGDALRYIEDVKVWAPVGERRSNYWVGLAKQ